MTANNSLAYLCNQDDSILVIIDIQTKLTAVMPPKVLARLQRNTSLLLKAAAILGVPCMVTEQYPQGLGNTEPEILKLLPQNSKTYAKTTFSCAGADGFLSDLKKSKRKQILLLGMEAHICILQSALTLVAENYQVIVLADAVCSRQRESYETTLLRLRQAGVTICDAESVLFEWLKDAKHEHFKTIQSLLTK